MILHEDITLGFIAGVLICVSINAICAIVGKLSASETQSDFDNGVVAKNTTTEATAVNNTADVVTETEVYKVVCVAPADGYCKDYSVRKINRE